MPTFAATKAGYRALWDRATIVASHAAAAKTAAVIIIAHKDIYQQIEAATGVPWSMIGCIHHRESDGDFNTYLGNGEPLNRVTRLVPKGRGPFKTFVLGAIDSLIIEGYADIKDWTPEHVLYSAEQFNGWGYTSHDENSPYMWAATSLQQRGKFDEDGHYDPNLWDQQLGFVAVLKAICALDPSVNAFMNPAPQPNLQGNPAGSKPQPKEPTVAPAPATATISGIQANELVKITQALETAVTYLPIISGFFPPLKPVVAFLPAIQAALHMLEQIEAANGDWQAIMTAIETNFTAIGAAIGQAKVKVATAPVVAPAAGVAFQASTGG